MIGTVSHVNNRQSIQCSNIQEVNCSSGHFLLLHEIYPELVSRIKGFFQPFIHPQQINITQLIADANAKRFVSYYILSGTAKYNELALSTLRINDRIVLIDINNCIENVKIHTLKGLTSFSAIADVNIRINVEGLTLQELLEKNKSIKRKSEKPQNVTLIQDMGLHQNLWVNVRKTAFNLDTAEPPFSQELNPA